MDIKSFRKLVNDSDLKDQLNNIEITLYFDYSDSEIKLKGIQSIYKFILDQVIGWNKAEKIVPYFLVSKMHFEGLKSNIIDFASYFNGQNQSQFNNHWNHIQSELSKTKKSNHHFIFLYDSPETDFLTSVYNKDSSYFDGALDYITKTESNYSNVANYFTGRLLGYEYTHQGESEIHKRRISEKQSLNQIKSKFNDYIVEAEQQLNGYLSDSKENLTTHFETVDKLKEEKDKNFEDWFKNTEGRFDNFYSLAQENIKTNEDLYREKLRLEAPADYWNKRASKLKNESNNYLDWLIRISLYGSLLLFVLLISLGNNFYQNVFNDHIKGIKWSLILITIISIIAFIIRILAKLYMSSLHLSRDAEEREQLTHFYLALKKDTTIEPEERQLILQSLFSRADTGLLKEDSSPTMPTSIIEKFSGGK